MNKNEKLSEHFTLGEMTATSQPFDNTPGAIALENLRTLCKQLETIRAKVGRPLRISSGFRSAKVNKAVGGSTYSHHRYGNAADIFCGQDLGLAVDVMNAAMTTDYAECILSQRGQNYWVHYAYDELSTQHYASMRIYS